MAAKTTCRGDFHDSDAAVAIQLSGYMGDPCAEKSTLAEKRALLLVSLVRLFLFVAFQVPLDEFGSQCLEMLGGPLRLVHDRCAE